MTAHLARFSFAVTLFALAGSACIDENILDQMADSQPKANRYRESNFFADGLTMLAPPKGTVPRERITLNAPLTTGREPDGPIQTNGCSMSGASATTSPAAPATGHWETGTASSPGRWRCARRRRCTATSIVRPATSMRSRPRGSA